MEEAQSWANASHNALKQFRLVCGRVQREKARAVNTRLATMLRTAQGSSVCPAIQSKYVERLDEDLANAWAYYRNHKDEIEQHIRKNEKA
jgi:hypothetical protein